MQKFVGEKREMTFLQTEQGIVVTFLDEEWEAKQMEIDNVVIVYMIAKYDDILYRIRLNFRPGTDVDEKKFLMGEMRYYCDGNWFVEAMLKLNDLTVSKANKDIDFREPKEFVQYFPRETFEK